MDEYEYLGGNAILFSELIRCPAGKEADCLFKRREVGYPPAEASGAGDLLLVGRGIVSNTVKMTLGINLKVTLVTFFGNAAETDVLFLPVIGATIDRLAAGLLIRLWWG